ncbi:DNA repair protein RadC [Sphingobacterium multivorum]|uniref:JAB domain-containing protein n=1 Tax=Sphingobacterium multivorum TaxID=28454 RepID=UPI000DFEEE62|nr:JAB domain-containing protein [Sphingobacterium multivorum]QQT43307.1 JAB domain-containing protein [Sphingobacterium multivorum]SUI98750.1 DNA repair protein RadC [Sphingobacterium multivorum]
MENYYELNEIKVSYKPAFNLTERPLVNSSAKIAKLLRDIWDDDTIQLFETFKVIFLNAQIKILGVMDIGLGGTDSTPVDVRRIFSTALLCNSVNIILSHNHPSGNLQPSNADRLITSRIIEAGELLNIKVLDHIIITENGYLSFSDEGFM